METTVTTLSHLARIAGGELHGSADPAVTSVELDSSRLADEGALFAAVPGTRRHLSLIHI